MIIKDISKVCSLEISTVRKIISESSFEISDKNLYVNKKYFDKNNFRKISLNHIIEISTARIEEITKLAKGFIYGVNVKGVTGVKTANSDNVLKMYSDIKKLTKIPVCSGFGIKTPADAEEIASTGVQGVVVGTTFVDYIEKNLNDTNL